MFYKIVCFVVKIAAVLVFNVKLHNSDGFNNSKGRYIICSNHICLLDPVMLAVYTKRQIHFMGKKELFENKILAYIFGKLGAFPVDRTGVTLSAIKHSLAVLKDDEVLGIFPEGTRVKEYNEENAKPGIAMIANKGKAPIIPVYIKGNYRFRGRIDIYFGEAKDYFEGYTGKLDSPKYEELGKKILRDIYMLGEQ